MPVAGPAKRRVQRRDVLAALGAGPLLWFCPPLRAETFLSADEARELIFPGGQFVPTEVTLSKDQAARIKSLSGVRVRNLTMQAWRSTGSFEEEGYSDEPSQGLAHGHPRHRERGGDDLLAERPRPRRRLHRGRLPVDLPGGALHPLDAETRLALKAGRQRAGRRTAAQKLSPETFLSGWFCCFSASLPACQATLRRRKRFHSMKGAPVR